MEDDFGLRHSFWQYFSPKTWPRSTQLIAFLVFYALIIPIYLLIGIQPADAAVPSASLDIPSLSLHAEVADVAPSGTTLETPAYAVGRYQRHAGTTLLFAHSTTAFSSLSRLKLGATIDYSGARYLVTSISDLEISKINMSSLLETRPVDTIILMTCSGTPSAGKYPSRLIITAEKV